MAVSGVWSGVLKENSEKSRENCWKNFPGSRNATNSGISGTGKGKPAGTVPAFSSFSEIRSLWFCQAAWSRPYASAARKVLGFRNAPDKM